jgi:DNA (cytosine-5)-methyltransferase 1
MEAPIQAIRNLKVPYQHMFSCDVNVHARKTIEANFPHGIMYDDVTKRDNKSAPATDLYIAGFPCQSFSIAGDKKGFKDRRGKIFFYVLDYIRKQRPRVFVLENVANLVRLDNGKYLHAIMKELENLGTYNITHKILNTKENGVPHSRKRWYCVGIMKSYDNGSFTFPSPMPCPSIEMFLEKRNRKLALTGLPPATSTTALRNVKLALGKLKKEGSDPFRKAFVVDHDSSTYRCGWSNGYVPCMTCRRGAGHWVTNRGRRLTKEEMMRFQGMDPTQFVVAVPDGPLGVQLGNTMSVNVLERLLVRLLPAAGLVKSNAVVDRWQNGQAVRALSRTRGRGFKKVNVQRCKRQATDAGSKCKRAKCE